MASDITLCAATYLSPSIPVEYFEMILHYLESKLGIYTSLLYESRWEGPRANRPDPFVSGGVDLGEISAVIPPAAVFHHTIRTAWMSSTVFLRMYKSKQSPIELLPVSSVHLYPRGEDKPGYFSDVIVRKDLGSKMKEFNDLRGCKWAYNGAESLSGHVITLEVLKELGENPSFFGHILYSGSHLESIRMVLSKKVDAAAVDANCLALFLDRNPHFKDDIKILTSWGMLPPYPFVTSTKCPESLKKKIVDCLLNMHKDMEGAKKLAEFRVRRFAPVSIEDFSQEQIMIDRTKDLSFGSAYY